MNLSTRQWEILAADASADVLHQGLVKINSIVFTEYTSDADTFVVTDRDDAVIFAGNGQADLAPVSSSFMSVWANGLKVPTLDTGKLLIYIE